MESRQNNRQQRVQNLQQGDMKSNPAPDKDLDMPPFVKSWKQFYLLLIGWLILLITAFYLFTKYFQ
jgi:hypothetical protein